MLPKIVIVENSGVCIGLKTTLFMIKNTKK